MFVVIRVHLRRLPDANVTPSPIHGVSLPTATLAAVALAKEAADSNVNCRLLLSSPGTGLARFGFGNELLQCHQRRRICDPRIRF